MNASDDIPGGARIYVAGHKGMVGSALVRKLKEEGYENLVLRSHAELDLTDQAATQGFFDDERPEYIFLAAAKVGGVLANSTFPAEFIRENLLIETNVIQNAFRIGAKKLLFLGSSCIYPREAPQPLKEAYLLTGTLEPTTEAYAIAKIAGVKMCQAYSRQYGADFISVMPPNLYGPNDNYDLQNSHVLPALLRKTHEAKDEGARSVTVWGSGQQRREFLHVDDLADACLFLMRRYDDSEPINVGVGEDLSIKDLAVLIKDTVGFDGDLEFDASKPDGIPRRLLDVSKLHMLGWHAKIGLAEGIGATYHWYLDSPMKAGRD